MHPARLLPGLLLLASCAVPRASSADQSPSPAPAGERVVLVELFTSEGCSSCPPADRVLGDLLDDEQIEVAAIAFHVDYWDYLGWKDRWSSDAWSQRQSRYAKAHGSRRVYTPQLLFDGRDASVGRREDLARQAIARAAAVPTSLRLGVTGQRRGTSIDADVEIAGVEGPGDLVMVALVQREASTRVRRGENAGRVLEHVAIALDLAEACRLGDAATQRCEVSLKAGTPDPGTRLELVAFVQDPASMQVHQAVRAPL